MFDTRQEEFSQREKRVLDIWEANHIFQQSLEIRKKGPVFSFYDGPPFATGLPHYGHLLAGTIKDVIPRYKTMKGYYVPRRFGWDCHGLPVENEIEKAKNLAGAPSIEKFGIANFNEECRQIVLRYTKQWKTTVSRMGRWVDFENSFKTMDASFMESVWWVFGRLWDLGLVYQGFKVMPFSAKLGTPLSNFEANLNYKDVDDPSLTIKLRLQQDPSTYLLVWTTTPWTLPSNLAAIVHPKIGYVKIKDRGSGECYILAHSRLEDYYKHTEEYEILAQMTGEQLVGLKYEPLFSYYAHHASPKAFSVLMDEFVGETDGTGIVHGAPAFGEFDFFVCNREGIDPVCPVDQNCKFTKEIPEYEGQFVKDADKEIIRYLKKENKVFKHTQIRHRYPFCYRSDTPLIYKSVTTWFVAVEKIKDKLLKANQEIYWMPAHIKEGRFGKWLENARDWAVSRNRYWGTPIPLWRSEDNQYIVMRSIEDLEQRTGKKIQDLHRHFIDDLTFEEGGRVFKRVPEVFDCWFESGSMPYAQNHYPFEHEKETLSRFPADFIAEGLDQTRGWFYTLVVLGAALFDQPAFKHVIVNGIILAEDGQKMSKSLKNYPDPMEVIERYGADAIRLYLLQSPVVQAEDLRFSEKGVEGVLRQFLLPLWNSYSFLATYARIYQWEPKGGKSKGALADIDRWILSLSQKLILQVEEALESYDLIKAIQPLLDFVDQLTNWYIRRSRQRFWSDEDTPDRREAFETLHGVLLTLVKVAAPFVPFLSEAIYQEIKEETQPLSVHLCDYPMYNKALRDESLEYTMALVQRAVSMGHNLRKEHKIKVRQPLKCANIITSDRQALEALKLQKALIEEELNVKEAAFFEDESAFVQIKIVPNYRTLGKKVGKLMNQVKERVEHLDAKALSRLQKEGSVTLEIGEEKIVLTEEDLQVKREVLEGKVALTLNDLTVTLETALTQELILEGFAREMINKINTMRKTEGFEITDRIVVKMKTTDLVKTAFESHKDYICQEVLATDVIFGEEGGLEVDLNGETARIALQKI
jgi:isoleucyl-tRNA synthetase